MRVMRRDEVLDLIVKIRCLVREDLMDGLADIREADQRQLDLVLDASRSLGRLYRAIKRPNSGHVPLVDRETRPIDLSGIERR